MEPPPMPSLRTSDDILMRVPRPGVVAGSAFREFLAGLEHAQENS
jgi:hypothetical protein